MKVRQIAFVLIGILLLVLSGRLMAGSGEVTASIETDPVPGRGDSADDPAIWVHAKRPELSTVIGTDKNGSGLAVYDLDGRQIQYVKMSGVNNVDLRDGFPFGMERTALAVASNPARDTLEVFRMDAEARKLYPVATQNNKSMTAVWGVCMYRSAKTGRFYAFNVGRWGQVEQWEILPAGERIRLNLVRSFDLMGNTEGCVADDETAAFYVSEEKRGIWRFGAEPNSGREGRLIDSTRRWSGRLRAEVEGLAVYDAGNGEGYLIASSQGNDRYVIYDRASNNYIGTFRIGRGSVDGVSNTDGIDVTNQSLGPAFPKGLFVVQDGKNHDSYILRKRQNFKLVRWETIASGFNPKLTIRTVP